MIAVRATLRQGPDRLCSEVGVPARTITRILRRHGLPRLSQCDPLTGEVIRASKATAVRYERDRPGELTHMDVKKIGRIRDGGGWKAHGRAMGATGAMKGHPVGFDYVHSLVDDHSRLACSEVLDPTPPGRTARWRDSTGPCRPNGPTGRSSPTTRNAPQP